MHRMVHDGGRQSVETQHVSHLPIWILQWYKGQAVIYNIFCSYNVIVHSYFINTFMFDITRMIQAVGFSECNTSTIKVSMMFSWGSSQCWTSSGLMAGTRLNWLRYSLSRRWTAGTSFTVIGLRPEVLGAYRRETCNNKIRKKENYPDITQGSRLAHTSGSR